MESNRAFYDRIARVYDLIADHDEHEARVAGEEALDLQPGEQVLEIGFGTGNSAINLARRVGESGKVRAIDVSTGMLQVAQEKIDEAGMHDRVELTVADARELPYEPATFDAVFASFTLELFEAERLPEVLAETKRVLRPGGRLGIVAMKAVKDGDHPSLMEKAYVWMHQHFPHIVDCRPIDAANLIEQAGFEVTRQDELKIWTIPVAVVVARRAPG